MPRHLVRLPEYELARTIEAAEEALRKAFPEWRIWPMNGYRAEKKTVAPGRETIHYVGSQTLLGLWFRLEEIEDAQKAGEDPE